MTSSSLRRASPKTWCGSPWDGEEPRRDEQRARGVQPALGLAALADEEDLGADERDGREDQVHVQRPAPVEVLGEDAPEEQANGCRSEERRALGRASCL